MDDGEDDDEDGDEYDYSDPSEDEDRELGVPDSARIRARRGVKRRRHVGFLAC